MASLLGRHSPRPLLLVEKTRSFPRRHSNGRTIPAPGDIQPSFPGRSLSRTRTVSTQSMCTVDQSEHDSDSSATLYSQQPHTTNEEARRHRELDHDPAEPVRLIHETHIRAEEVLQHRPNQGEEAYVNSQPWKEVQPRRHEELSDSYNPVGSWDHDKEVVEQWKDELDVLLTFSGLFLAVVAGFSAVYFTQLHPGVLDPSPDILHQISIQISSYINRDGFINSTAGPFSYIDPAHHHHRPPPNHITVIIINCLWFTSIVLDVGAAILNIFARELLNRNMVLQGKDGSDSRNPASDFIHSGWYTASKQWVFCILRVVPIMLLLALVVFVIGFVSMLWTLSRTTAVVVIVEVSAGLLVAIILTIGIKIHADYHASRIRGWRHRVRQWPARQRERIRKIHPTISLPGRPKSTSEYVQV